jgi:hypothetical protein
VTKDRVNKTTAVDDMLADLDLTTDEAGRVRAALNDVAALANEIPEPSEDVRALLGGAIPLRRRRRTPYVAAVAVALALGGVSAAAAANRLPDPIQKIVADTADGVLPINVPHPVKPTNPPYDAPGHVRNKPKAPKPGNSVTPQPAHPTPPGQVQKATKPDPKAPGPAKPADPGSFGRAHRTSDRADKSDHASDQGSGDSDDSEGRSSGQSGRSGPDKTKGD